MIFFVADSTLQWHSFFLDSARGGEHVSRYSVANSQSSLIHSVQPSDCTSAGFVLGGVTMKMMDEVAGIVAFRHCKSNVVTASIGTCKFLIV